MKFYGIDAQGYIKVQETTGDGGSDNPPIFSEGTDERRIAYVQDTVNSNDAVYFAGDLTNNWVRVVLDDDATYSNLKTSLGGDFHPLGGSVSNTITALSYTGTSNRLRVTDDWVKVSDNTPITTGGKAGFSIELTSAGSDSDDAELYYDYDQANILGYGAKWKLNGGGYTNEPIATHSYVGVAITNGLGTYVSLTTANNRYVRYQHLDDGGIGNTTWKQWTELTATYLGAATASGGTAAVYPAYPDRQVYRTNEAFNGFVRTANWTQFDGATAETSPARYAYVGTVATPRTTTPYQNTIVQRDGTGNIFANIGYLEATSAQYADLAEKYTCDESLPVGTVVEVSNGTEDEVVPVMFALSISVVGVVSDNPAYLMNSGSQGLPIALTGKVPVRVVGGVTKGDFIVPAGDGCARKGEIDEVAFKIGVVLKTYLQTDEKLVECIIK